VLTDDVDVWRERAHTHLEIYTGLPNYVGNWLRMGLTEDDAVRGQRPAQIRVGVPRNRSDNASG
jgi:hypothetical protein